MRSGVLRHTVITRVDSAHNTVTRHYYNNTYKERYRESNVSLKQDLSKDMSVVVVISSRDGSVRESGGGGHGLI